MDIDEQLAFRLAQEGWYVDFYAGCYTAVPFSPTVPAARVAARVVLIRMINRRRRETRADRP